MIPQSPFDFHIGAHGWAEHVRETCARLSPGYLDDFTPCSQAEIAEVERALHRSLPEDFKNWLIEIGTGQFERYGGVYSVEELVLVTAQSIFYPTGSADWASESAHIDLWISRGARNPDPSRFTLELLTLEEFFLLDWLQVAWDGHCGAFYGYMGDGQPKHRCFLYNSGELDGRFASFSEGIRSFLNDEWNSHFDLIDY